MLTLTRKSGEKIILIQNGKKVGEIKVTKRAKENFSDWIFEIETSHGLKVFREELYNKMQEQEGND